MSSQPVVSPLEGTKITVNNLHPRVTEEDIVVSASRRSHEPPPLCLCNGLWHCDAAVIHPVCVCMCVCLWSVWLQELFCVCGALKRARLVKVGVAEVVFVRKEDAVSAYRKYNNRCLDGRCRWQGRARQNGIMGSGLCSMCRSMTKWSEERSLSFLFC